MSDDPVCAWCNNDIYSGPVVCCGDEFHEDCYEEHVDETHEDDD